MKRIGILLAVILTAKLGRIEYMGHTETWYDLNMNKVVQNTDNALGTNNLYWVREDGVKCYGPWVIVASHPSITRYSLVETSLGPGIVLDRHTAGDVNLYDIATAWKE